MEWCLTISSCIHLPVSQLIKFSFCKPDHRANILASWMQFNSWLRLSNWWLFVISAIRKNSDVHTFISCIPENYFPGVRTFSHCSAQQVSAEISLRVLGKVNLLLLKRHIVFTADIFIVLHQIGFFVWTLCFSNISNLFMAAVFFTVISGWKEIYKEKENLAGHLRTLRYFAPLSIVYIRKQVSGEQCLFLQGRCVKGAASAV